MYFKTYWGKVATFLRHTLIYTHFKENNNLMENLGLPAVFSINKNTFFLFELIYEKWHLTKHYNTEKYRPLWSFL